METPVVSRGEKILLYAFAGISDLVQLILSAFVVTEVVNHFLDFIIGGIIILYAYKRKLLTWEKALTLIAVFVGEQVPFVNALPFWTYDIHNIYRGVPSQQVSVNLKVAGVTPPRINRKPVNSIPGVRPPRLPKVR